MFTSEEIRDIKFSKAGLGGYKAADVDDFRFEVAQDFENLETSNAELVEKIKILAEHIQKLQENEEAVKTCLINAQIVADKAVKEAQEKSEEILAQAQQKADELVLQATQKADAIFSETKVKSEEFLTAAKEKGDAIVSQAENEAITLRNETDKKIEQQKKVYERLKQEVVNFRSESIAVCENQLKLLKNVSDAELILEMATNTDTTSEEFSKIIDETVDTDAQPQTQMDEVETAEEDESLQGSLFE